MLDAANLPSADAPEPHEDKVRTMVGAELLDKRAQRQAASVITLCIPRPGCSQPRAGQVFRVAAVVRCFVAMRVVVEGCRRMQWGTESRRTAWDQAAQIRQAVGEAMAAHSAWPA